MRNMLRIISAILFGLFGGLCAYSFVVFLYGIVYPYPPISAFYGTSDPRSSGGLHMLFVAAMALLIIGTGVFAFQAIRKRHTQKIWRASIAMGCLVLAGLGLSYLEYIGVTL